MKTFGNKRLLGMAPNNNAIAIVSYLRFGTYKECSFYIGKSCCDADFVPVSEFEKNNG